MRAIVITLAVVVLAATAASANEPSLAARDGVWVCLPDDTVAPQVYVDFEENVYRRCDQNICSLYDIVSVRRLRDVTEIAFAPGAVMRAEDDGTRYSESLVVGSATVTTSGRCRFRGDAN